MFFYRTGIEAVQHFLFGIAIDEGFKGPQANNLAWDVLYPEVKGCQKSFEVTNRNLAILYIVANDHAPAKDEPQSRNIVRTISYSLH